jgi:Ca2+/Na+ antiporter
VFRVEGIKIALASTDLIVIGLSLMGIYAFYIIALVRYFAEGKDNEESMPPDPHRLGHNTSWGGILSVMALGTVGAYAGGESIGAFAGTALNQLGLPTIPTAAGLAFFAGISEYLIVFKSHRRGELGIALSNVFGGMTQVMFLLLPLAMILIGVFGLVTGDPRFVLPINAPTTLLMVLLFPLFYALHQHVELEGTLTVLDAVAMTGIYLLLLFFLFTTPG